MWMICTMTTSHLSASADCLIGGKMRNTPRTRVFLGIELNPKIQVYIIQMGSSRQIQWWWSRFEQMTIDREN
jgi:hypothetical protein